MKKVHEEVTGWSFRLLQAAPAGHRQFQLVHPLNLQNIQDLFLENSSGNQCQRLHRYG